jgi:protein-tyrosine-phosphatase
MHRVRSVLLLCTGDTCRSPMAVGYFRKLLEEGGVKNVDVRGAGVMTITGLLATPETVQLMDEENVDMRKHRSAQLTRDMIRKADLILGMTPFHVQSALRLSEEARGKTFLFKEFTGSDAKDAQIPDPMGCTLEVYKRVFNEIKSACRKLVRLEIVTGKKLKPPAKKPVVQKPAVKKPPKPRPKRPARAAKRAKKPRKKPRAEKKPRAKKKPRRRAAASARKPAARLKKRQARKTKSRRRR